MDSTESSESMQSMHGIHGIHGLRWPCSGRRTLDIFGMWWWWPVVEGCLGCVWDMFWDVLGTGLGHVSDVFWTSFGHVLDELVCSGYFWNLLGACVVHV